MNQGQGLPVIDVSALADGSRGASEVAAAIDHACRAWGFFTIVNHGIPPELERQLELESRQFFNRSLARKQEIAMARGRRAWRGYFGVGEELTSGVPDLKEGLYFGQELPPEHPLVRSGVPMHGPNLFPEDMPQFRATVNAYIEALTSLGHRLMTGISLALGLERHYFERHCTGNPLALFRIFHYPPALPQDNRWGVGEHTDYGLLTILKQDDVGGLEVKSGAGWLAVPPIPGTFVCNIGDMLERMTGGLYRSTAHRVRNPSGRSRLSFPFFFDPGFDVRVEPVPGRAEVEADEPRWDGANLFDWQGTYGDYLLSKVGRVFPQLRQVVLEDQE